MKRTSIIQKCTCKHEGQDALYGEGMRVWNPAGKETGYRCTVCGAVTGDAPRSITKRERVLKGESRRH